MKGHIVGDCGLYERDAWYGTMFRSSFQGLYIVIPSSWFCVICCFCFWMSLEWKSILTYTYTFYVMALWTTWMQLFRAHDFFEQPILMWICRFKTIFQCCIKHNGDGSSNLICNLFNIWISIHIIMCTCNDPQICISYQRMSSLTQPSIAGLIEWNNAEFFWSRVWNKDAYSTWQSFHVNEASIFCTMCSICVITFHRRELTSSSVKVKK